MIWLILGALVLAAVLVGSNRLGQINPTALAAVLRWAGIAALGGVAAYLALTGRIALDLPMLLFLVPRVRRWLSAQTSPGARAAGASASGASDVRTAMLHMSLSHASGTISGDVLTGRFAGRQLAELDLSQLLQLLDECRATDLESVPLLEAYLDRFDADWRQRGPSAGTVKDDGPMTRDEAFRILELAPTASEQDIRAAHHRLMKKLHPDQGGSTYLASKVNQAKDLLLDS